jgi:hypothetical protein
MKYQRAEYLRMGHTVAFRGAGGRVGAFTIPGAGTRNAREKGQRLVEAA